MATRWKLMSKEEAGSRKPHPTLAGYYAVMEMKAMIPDQYDPEPHTINNFNQCTIDQLHSGSGNNIKGTS